MPLAAAGAGLETVCRQKAGAYERLVDELLTSPHYGEHQALIGWTPFATATRKWIAPDKRAIYPYCDWVVRALNGISRSIISHLATGRRHAAEPTLEQQVATGFVRMNPTTAEGGASLRSFRQRIILIGWKQWVRRSSA